MIRLKSPFTPIFLCYTLFGVFGSACAQEEVPPTPGEIQAAETAPLFASHEILKITLEADFHTIRREDRSDEDSQERPAVMKWTKADGAVETQDIQVQTREHGIFPFQRAARRRERQFKQGQEEKECRRIELDLASEGPGPCDGPGEGIAP